LSFVVWHSKFVNHKGHEDTQRKSAPTNLFRKV
jgi:hypothetical protein